MRARGTSDDNIQMKQITNNKKVRYHYMERGADEGTKERFKQKPYGMKKESNNEE